MILEGAADYILGRLISNGDVYLFVEVFAGVALVEELCKYFFLKRTTWRSPEFNFRFDGIVYAAFTSLGFAALENIMYVFSNGLGTAVARALLSIPGHCIFGIYMGYYYGLAKQADYAGDENQSRRNRRLALLVPTILHGIYDYLAFAMSVYTDANNEPRLWIIGAFLVFVIVMDIVSIRTVKQAAGEDIRIAPGYYRQDQFSDR